jgi:hypothetical protein
MASKIEFSVRAKVCDGHGPFDSAYGFGDEGDMVGTADEIALALGHFLSEIGPDEIKEMEHETGVFYVELKIKVAKDPCE